MNHKWDVVIVGGGLAGYIAANYLTRTNLSILILEKGKNVGGRARTNRMNGQCFNLGPHALYKKGKAMSLLEELSIVLNGKSPKLSGSLLDNHLKYTAPFSPFGIFTTSLLKTKERLEWIAVLVKIMNIDSEKLAELTFQQWVEQITHSKVIKSLLYTLGRLATYCHAPEKTSAAVVVSHVKQAMGGVLYLDGGWQTIIDQLHNKAILSDVHVRSQTLVKQIDRDQQGQFKLTLSNDEEILSKYVICTTGPHELITMLGENLNLPNRDFFVHLSPVKGATLDIALSELPNPKCLFAMDINAPLYYSVHSAYAHLSHDRKAVVLHVFKYHHPNEQIDGPSVKNELEQFLDRLQPDWQQHVISRRFIPDITVNQRLPQIGDELLLQRSETEIPGLYIAGDWTSPHAILADGAISSGKQAAVEIILNEKRNHRANNKGRVSAI